MFGASHLKPIECHESRRQSLQSRAEDLEPIETKFVMMIELHMVYKSNRSDEV